MATQMETGLPSLLVEAARSAAEADGVETPLQEEAPTSSGANAEAAAATLTSIGVNQEDDPMQQARAAIAAQKNMVESAPTAGSAAFLASSTAPPPAASTRRMTGATSSPAPASNGSKKKGPPLRRGKWTQEEEAYANRLIQEFKAGLLPLSDGTTLRTFLSKLLNCDPMRISKKFVGNNCIGKQVFRRRTADINRLTPEQIQQSRIELSELERRFLERVAQTNRVKSSGVGAGAAGPGMPGIKLKDEADSGAPTPPWLQPPLGYKHGTGAAMAAANLSGGIANARAAAAGRALLMGLGGRSSNLARKGSNPSLTSSGSAGLLALAGAQSFQNAFAKTSATNLLAAAAAAGGSGLSGSAMAQIARNASAARLANLTAGGNSMNNLMLQTGLSRDQLNALASGNSLSNMMERQSSFDALMSLDFQSLQSIDNLANLIQTNGGVPGQVPENGMKNWQPESASNSSANLADARRLASVGRMESLLRSLSSSNVNKDGSSSSNTAGSGSNANFSNLIQSMQNSNSTNSLFGGNSASAASLANLLRADSSTGLTALRMQDGLNHRNTSVDDFLSLVASGEISHHDPLLNVPMNVQHQQGLSQGQAAQLIVQQQLMAQASASGNSALANALRAGSLGNLQKNNNSNSEEAGQDEKATTADEDTSGTKRKLDDEDAGEEQGPSKR